MSTTFSPARVASPRLAAYAVELGGALRGAPCRVRRAAAAVRGRSRRARCRGAARRRGGRRRRDRRSAALPLLEARSGRATGWRSCPGIAPAPISSTSPSGPLASAAGRGWSRRCRCANVRFFERLGWEWDGERGGVPRRHAPADGDSPVSGVSLRSQAGNSLSRRTRVSSKLPHTPACETAAREHLARRPRVASSRAGSRSSGRPSASARSARRPAAGSPRRSDSLRIRRPRSSAAASRRCRASTRPSPHARARLRRSRPARRRRSERLRRRGRGARSRTAASRSSSGPRWRTRRRACRRAARCSLAAGAWRSRCRTPTAPARGRA